MPPRSPSGFMSRPVPGGSTRFEERLVHVLDDREETGRGVLVDAGHGEERSPHTRCAAPARPRRETSRTRSLRASATCPPRRRARLKRLLAVPAALGAVHVDLQLEVGEQRRRGRRPGEAEVALVAQPDVLERRGRRRACPRGPTESTRRTRCRRESAGRRAGRNPCRGRRRCCRAACWSAGRSTPPTTAPS